MAQAGCAQGSSSGGGPDLGTMGGRGICPGHPEQCGGQCCGDRCVDTSIDPKNCGGCNLECDSGQLCRSGSCGCLPSGTKCGTGQTCCGQTGCVSLQSDIKNCGSCGHQCGDGATCMNGACACGGQTCSGSDVCCNGACASSCATDMGTSSGGDMGMGMSGLCTCADHCAGDPFGICVGTNCCYFSAFTGACQIGSCQPNPSP